MAFFILTSLPKKKGRWAKYMIKHKWLTMECMWCQMKNRISENKSRIFSTSSQRFCSYACILGSQSYCFQWGLFTGRCDQECSLSLIMMHIFTDSRIISMYLCYLKGPREKCMLFSTAPPPPPQHTLHLHFCGYGSCGTKLVQILVYKYHRLPTNKDWHTDFKSERDVTDFKSWSAVQLWLGPSGYPQLRICGSPIAPFRSLQKCLEDMKCGCVGAWKRAPLGQCNFMDVSTWQKFCTCIGWIMVYADVTQRVLQVCETERKGLTAMLPCPHFVHFTTLPWISE